MFSDACMWTFPSARLGRYALASGVNTGGGGSAGFGAEREPAKTTEDQDARQRNYDSWQQNR